MNTQTKTYAKNIKTPSKQSGVVVLPAAFIAVGLGLVGVGIDNRVNQERTNYAVEAQAPANTQQQESSNNEFDDFFSSVD